MPTLSMFYGILIQMFWADHAPPHFHALYAEFEALVDIRTLEVIRGSLPRRRWPWCSNGRRCIVKNSWRIGTYAQANKSHRRYSPWNNSGCSLESSSFRP